MHCLDEVLFFEERFESSLEFDLVLQSEPVADDFVPMIIWPWQALGPYRPPSDTAHGWHRPPARAPPATAPRLPILRPPRLALARPFAS